MTARRPVARLQGQDTPGHSALAYSNTLGHIHGEQQSRTAHWLNVPSDSGVREESGMRFHLHIYQLPGCGPIGSTDSHQQVSSGVLPSRSCGPGEQPPGPARGSV